MVLDKSTASTTCVQFPYGIKLARTIEEDFYLVSFSITVENISCFYDEVVLDVSKHFANFDPLNCSNLCFE